MILRRFLPGILTTLLLSSTPLLHAASPTLNVKDYGATGDGKTLDSPAIQKAIDACTAQGGGIVQIPAGTFLTGTLLLKDNVTLNLDPKATLLGSTNLDDYQNVDPFTEGLGNQVGWALLAAVKSKNIAVTGSGMIDGQGKAVAATQTGSVSKIWGRRPFLVRLVECENVKISGVTLHYAAAWTTNLFHCKNISIDSLTILSRGVPHNDGIDIDGCQQMQINNCDIDSGDDAIVFKTTSSTLACKDITISNCKLKSSQGAIKTGTESMANFENITITHCDIRDTSNGGIKLLAVDGASIKHILISDITMTNVQTPILMRLGSRLNVFRKGEEKQQVGIFEDVTLKNIHAKAAAKAQLMPPSGILITGIPGHPITGVTLDHIDINLAGGGTTDMVTTQVPEKETAYPEVKTFGPRLPAYGLFARHVSNLTLSNISFTLDTPDLRPALFFQDASNLQLSDLTFPKTTGADSLIHLESTTNAQIANLTFPGFAKQLIDADAKSTGIQIAK